MPPSRLPRRAFAAPLVLIAAVPACIVATKGGDAPPEPTRVANPPPPRTDPGEGETSGTIEHPGHGHGQPRPRVDPPPPGEETRDPGAGAAPADARTWTIVMASDGTCSAILDVACQPNATCNPPPPRPVACPDGIAAARPWKLHAAAGSTECYAIAPAATCPKGATCNPPPPRKHACPK